MMKVTESQLAEIMAALRMGNTIGAIKLYRDATGGELADAKAAVTQLAATRTDCGSAQMPAKGSLQTMADAKRFFQSMGCSRFQMQRESPEEYQAYRSLGIKQETEKEWAADDLRLGLSRLEDPATDHSELWSIHFHLAELIENWCLYPALNDVFEATVLIAPLISRRDRLLVAKTIVGHAQGANSAGLIDSCGRRSQPNLALRFMRLAKQLIDQPFAVAELDLRRERLLMALDALASHYPEEPAGQ